MPRRVGKEVAQQVEFTPVSPRHSESENNLKHLPPISPLADRSYGNPIYRNDDEEKVDSTESSNKISQELQQIRKLQEEANQNIKRSLESFLQAQQKQQQQNNPAGGILRPQDLVEATFRVAEQLNANQQRYVPPARHPNPAPQPNCQNNAFQPLGQQAAPPPLDRNQLIDLVQETYGPALRPLVRPSYHKPYPNYINQDNPFPHGFKVPEFTLFSGDASQSTIEHIGRFTIQCGEASGDDFLKLRLFPSSLMEPKISMADLSRLTQWPGESFENYLLQFRKAQMKCHVALPEQEFMKLVQNGLNIELQKKFEGMEFRDFFELSYKVFADKPVTCPNLVKVTQQVEAAAKRLLYESGRQYTFDVTKANEIFDYLKKSGHIKLPQGPRLPTVVEIASKDYYKINKGLLHFPEKPKEAMGVDENPFLNVDDGVNVVDIRSISRRTYKGRTLVADDLRWVSEKEREHRAQQNQRLDGQRHAARIYASGFRMKEAQHTDRSHMVKHPQRRPSKRWEKVVHPKFPKEHVKNPRTLRRRLQRKQVEARHRQQLAIEEVKSKVPPFKLTSLIVNENELKATFEADQQAELTSNDNLLKDMDVLQIDDISINLSCLVLTLPLVFQAKGNESTHVPTHVSTGSMVVEEEVIEVPTQEEEEENDILSEQIIFDKPNEIVIKNGKLRVCIDFRNLNLVTPKDEDPMPVANLLVDGVAYHRILSFMDGHSGYNQIFIAKEDTSKMAFHCPGNIGTYEWVVMPFGLKNAGVTYQQAMNAIFHDMIGRFMEIYIDDAVVKSMEDEEDLEHLRKAFKRMRQHGLKMNSLKCAFGVTAGNLLGFLVHERGLEVVHKGEEDTHTNGVTMEELDLALVKLDDLRADVQDPLKEVNLRTKAEPRITFVIVKKNGKLRVCIDFRNLNLVTPKDEDPMPVAYLLVDGVAYHRILSFMDGHSGYNQIFITEEDISKAAFHCPGNIGTYEWVVMPFGLKDAGVTYQQAMNAIFHDMIGRFMEIYIDDIVVKSMEDEEHLEHLRKAFKRMQQHGLKMNSLKCAFGVTAGNLLGFLVHERGLELQPDADFKWERQHQAAFDAIKEYLSKPPVLVPAPLLRGHIDHPCLDVNVDEDKGINLFSIDLVPWRLIFDGSSIDQAFEAGIIIVSPNGIKTQWCFQLDFECTNNQAEYEALVIGLELLIELKEPSVEIVDDSQLFLKQLSGKYKCTSVVLSPYFATAIQLLEEFDDVSLKHNPRMMNVKANELAQIASSVKMPRGILEKVIVIEKLAIDYFTKWVEARPIKKVEQGVVIKFIKEDLIHRFGLPETVTSDQGTAFVGSQVEAFIKGMGFRLLNSTPHYAQANGQAKASNKIIINILEKMVTTFLITYGYNAILPMELTARSLRIAIQNGLNAGKYNEAMIMKLEDLEEARLTALDAMKVQKLKVAQAYNKRVRQKNLAEGSLVWKAVLPLGKRDPRYGKWSPNWEKPFQIHKVLKGGAYWLKSLNGELHPRKINGIYLKPYYPIVWEARDNSASTSA
ncbi:hypothetical protein SLEP1_g38905 [Rubroshorea leprosula]|uniref:Integrase catalytic domain-containing protein n=2 Tax=Rubroshorea leprosula TaxID=152421 RepID=A0AAV5KYH8_9ROSI|nr:hypothetical protein SLEP1_g38905 [Rubroshorea leprosula]